MRKEAPFKREKEVKPDLPQLEAPASLQFGPAPAPTESFYSPPPKQSTPFWPYIIVAAICAGILLVPKFLHKPKPADQPPAVGTPAPKPPDAVAPTPTEPPKPPEAAQPPEPVKPDIPAEQPPPPDKPVTKKPPKKAPAAKKPATPEDPVYVENPPPAAPKGDLNEFRARGTVYALLTLAPVEGADVVFTNLSTGNRYTTETDPSGGFRATLPVSPNGYSLAIRHAEYEPSYVIDEDGAIRRMSEAQRAEVAQSQARTLQSAQNVNSPGGTVLKRDFAVLPRMR